MLQLSERTLGDWLEHWAEVTPDKEYIVYSDRNLRFTWKQFNERVDHMAKGLLAIGVKKDTHVGIWARNVPDYNPQNEMFRLLGTKRSFSQNETFFFSHPYPLYPALFRLISHF